MGSKIPASFRDACGFLYYDENGILLRQVNGKYAAHYDLLMGSGLYGRLISSGMLVRHEETAGTGSAFKTLKPEKLPFISYPYEWSFSQLKDAALLTLSIQKEALGHGMILKDASAYNVQFRGAKPVFIDTLSFEAYTEGSPWAAYRQFCMHFLAPLALCAQTDQSLSGLLGRNLEGIPLSTASRMLPMKSWLNFGLLMHLHLHARADRAHGNSSRGKPAGLKVSSQSLLAMAESLESVIIALKSAGEKTFWRDYYSEMHNYTEEGLDAKAGIVRQACEAVRPEMVWDIGANTGRFSAIAAETAACTIAMDFDRAAVQNHYLALKKAASTRIMPLLQDLANPSPALGWAGEERSSLEQRGPADLVMALALVHHICIGNNVPLDAFFAYMSRLGKHLLVEFVPKDDSQVAEMLLMREDIFPSYTEPGFEHAAEPYFETLFKKPVKGTKRTLYLFRKKRG